MANQSGNFLSDNLKFGSAISSAAILGATAIFALQAQTAFAGSQHHGYRPHGHNIAISSSAAMFRDPGNGFYAIVPAPIALNAPFGAAKPHVTMGTQKPAKIINVEDEAGSDCTFEAGVCIIRGAQ